ncbi:hypothetical protein FGB62_112g228 [Gracilaria domingensis]|nr:hypothetical protein FGB62_112g228 [Gracilaria domingensis]
MQCESLVEEERLEHVRNDTDVHLVRIPVGKRRIPSDVVHSDHSRHVHAFLGHGGCATAAAGENGDPRHSRMGVARGCEPDSGRRYSNAALSDGQSSAAAERHARRIVATRVLSGRDGHGFSGVSVQKVA